MTAFYNEFDPQAAAWLRELIKAGLIAPGVVDERSILDLEPSDLEGFVQVHFFAGIGGWSCALRLAGWPDDKPVWTGSPPCQPFSSAGQRKGNQDDRHLAPYFVELVRARRPGVLFGEQVASSAVFGKVTGGSKRKTARAPEWAWFDDLSDRLEAALYAVGASDTPAAGVGAPHIRQRTFFGAFDTRPAPGGMANDGNSRWQGRLPRGSDTGRENQHGHVGCSGTTDGLEHGPSDGRIERGAGTDGRGFTSGRGPERLAVTNSRKCGGVAEHEKHERDWPEGGWVQRDGKSSGGGAVVGALPINGFWRDADWLFCRDGKWRPVEPGTFPLVNGLSGRVGLLRGYGNAIVPQAAAQFIETFQEALGECVRLNEVSVLADDKEDVFA